MGCGAVSLLPSAAGLFAQPPWSRCGHEALDAPEATMLRPQAPVKAEGVC